MGESKRHRGDSFEMHKCSVRDGGLVATSHIQLVDAFEMHKRSIGDIFTIRHIQTLEPCKMPKVLICKFPKAPMTTTHICRLCSWKARSPRVHATFYYRFLIPPLMLRHCLLELSAEHAKYSCILRGEKRKQGTLGMR